MLPLWLNPEPPDADASKCAQSVEPRFGVDGAGDAVVEIGLGVDQGSPAVKRVVAAAEEAVFNVDGSAAAAGVVVDVVGGGLVAPVEEASCS